MTTQVGGAGGRPDELRRVTGAGAVDEAAPGAATAAPAGKTDAQPDAPAASTRPFSTGLAGAVLQGKLADLELEPGLEPPPPLTDKEIDELLDALGVPEGEREGIRRQVREGVLERGPTPTGDDGRRLSGGEVASTLGATSGKNKVDRAVELYRRFQEIQRQDPTGSKLQEKRRLEGELRQKLVDKLAERGLTIEDLRRMVGDPKAQARWVERYLRENSPSEKDSVKLKKILDDFIAGAVADLHVLDDVKREADALDYSPGSAFFKEFMRAWESLTKAERDEANRRCRALSGGAKKP
jgi:hypothetical protein